MRNVLIHGYATIDDEVVWRAATERVPALRRIFKNMLDHRGIDGSAGPHPTPPATG
ncbi:HepT-like ribonuclease domain-containing protein [Tomitella cavernea]|uniref:HepT-like ribonuclease domain-containing protein n=1 Tax=Tomitella cavernea TaxID=1387982 RepID=UPI0035565D7D